MKEHKGSEFLVGGYLTFGEPKEMTIGGCNDAIKRYQGDHEDEYSLKKYRKVCIFQNGILKIIYEEGERETPIR